MKEPYYILKNGTRIKTHSELEATRGLLITSRHLNLRKPDAMGIVVGIVGGHGGDVYFVAHLGDADAAAYCFTEFELVVVKNPCTACAGNGTMPVLSREWKRWMPCLVCGGSGEDVEVLMQQIKDGSLALKQASPFVQTMVHYRMFSKMCVGGEIVNGWDGKKAE